MPGSLGLGFSLGASTSGGSASQAAVEGSNFWEIVSSGTIQPLDVGAVTDYSLCWDLDGTDYMPQESGTSDGLWSVESGDLKPNDV